MSDYYDLADSVRSQEDLARAHRGYDYRADEIEKLNTVALLCVLAGFALLWLVLR